MFKKLNFKILAGVFVLLLGFVIINNLVEKKKGDRTFKSYIVEFDSAKVDYIHIIPKSKEGEIVLKKEDDWKLLYKDKLVSADKAAIYDIFTQLADLKPSRIAATKKEKWEEYELNDSLSTKVTLKEDGDVVAELYIGKFDYKQQPQGGNPYQRQNPQFFTFVRSGDDNTVYVVEQFLSMTFNRELNAFRNKVVVDSKNEDWTKLTFNYPADSSFYLMKQNNQWMMDGVVVDSVKIENYFNSLSRKTNASFVEMDKAALSNPIFSMTIEGNNLASIQLQAYSADSTHQYYVTSSQNPDAVFSGANLNLAQDVFAGPSRFEYKEEQVEIDITE
jgi:uncharacterized protein DUF4340